LSHPEASVLDTALSPFERASEIIFGILMAISVTAAFEITAGAELDVRELMIAALGCNLAWGLIDGVIYLLHQQVERHRNHQTMLELRGTVADEAFRERVKDALPPVFGPAVTADTFARFRQVVQSYSAQRPPFWSGREFAVAGIIALLVFASTFPLVLPFMIMQDAWLALRASHAIAVLFLFVLGWRIGRWSGASALGCGLVFAAVGATLAVMCVALGG
jgi:VIT1/CCC1 family predicted Fe2+/Mn2+ transporter